MYEIVMSPVIILTRQLEQWNRLNRLKIAPVSYAASQGARTIQTNEGFPTHNVTQISCITEKTNAIYTHSIILVSNEGK
jgi:hypothetical protein